jgi:hypothetical protein
MPASDCIIAPIPVSNAISIPKARTIQTDVALICIDLRPNLTPSTICGKEEDCRICSSAKKAKTIYFNDFYHYRAMKDFN